jgi:hypothetical protein
MSVNYTTNLALGQPVTGTESGTWGDDVNNSVTSYLDIAIAGGLAVTVTTADVTLSNTQGTSSATNIGSTTAQYAILNISGAMTAARNLIVPSSSKSYIIYNNTTGGYTLTVKGSATTGVGLINGEKAIVAWNGSDYIKISSSVISNSTGILPIANGGTNSTATATAGGVGYGTGTAHAYTAVGTSGQALISAAASAPSFGTLGIAGGGTGLTTTPVNGALDIGNGTGFTRTTLSAGSGVTITNSSGGISIAATGSGGTVTSVGWTGGIVSVASSTTTPAFTIAGTSGGIPYFNSGTTWATSGALTQYGVVYGGGAGAAPVATAAGTTGQAFIANTSAAPAWGTLGIAGGGTGLTTTPANGALDIGNGTGFTRTTLTQGTGITITNASGSITIAATGSGMVYPGAGIPNSTGSAWGTSYTTSGSGTVVALNNTPTLTNPTITNYVETPYTATISAGAITLDLTNGTVQFITFGAASATITMPTAVSGKSFTLFLKQDSVGSRSATWSTVSWPSATAPTLTSTANKLDKFVFTSNGTSWFGSTAGQNYT